MWTLELEVDASKTTIGPLVIRHQVMLYMYPVAINRMTNFYRIHFTGSLFGSPRNIEHFVQDLKKHPRIRNIEIQGNFFVGAFDESVCFEPFYHPEILHLRPWILDGKKKLNKVLVGSWNKKHLTQLVDILKNHHITKVIKVQKKGISSFLMVDSRPQLTVKQRYAFDLAVHQGYYKYPRKVDIRDLARMAKISYSTFQAHLRKAEQKVLPFSQIHL